MAPAPHVLVLGAGISGLVTAYELAERGFEVTVVEAAPMAGGRTSSWTDRDGREVDTGLHVVADHYVNLIEILGRLGASRHLRWFDKHLYLSRTREPLDWYFSPWPPPFHLLRPLRVMPVPVLARAGMALAGLRTATRSQAELAEFDDITYAQWHERHRMGDGFLRDLGEAAADAAAFLDIERVAARPVLSWMKYLMRDRKSGDVGIFTGTFQQCLVDPLVQALVARGGRLRTATAAIELEHDDSGITAVRVAPTAARGPLTNASGEVPLLGGGATERLACDALVIALSVQGFQRLVSPALARAAGLEPALELTTTSAMSLLVWFDRAIDPPPGAPLVSGCAMRDFIDLTVVGRSTGTPGSVYQFVITHAEQRWERSDEEILREVLADLHTLWPASRGARPIAHALERIESAMFAAVPGAHRRRPLARTRLPNLFVAGDFTRHESNASMEGAAVSGRLAADALLRSMGLPGLAVRTPPDPVGMEALARLRRRLRGSPEAL